MDVAERPCSAEFGYGTSNGSVPNGTQIITRMARESSQACGLAFEHPGARGKADWWHAVFHVSTRARRASEQSPGELRRASTPRYGKQTVIFHHKGTESANGKFAKGERSAGRIMPTDHFCRISPRFLLTFLPPS